MVDYHPCCEGSCDMPDPSYGGYGLVCSKGGYKPTAPPAPKCYKEGERCIGAPGKPFVEYCSCCEGACDKPDPSYGGYGMVCSKGGYTPSPPTKAPVYTTPPKAYTVVEPKCVKSGESCDPYGLKCCDMVSCVASSKNPGKYCCE
jgi:hypothetical protein